MKSTIKEEVLEQRIVFYSDTCVPFGKTRPIQGFPCPGNPLGRFPVHKASIIASTIWVRRNCIDNIHPAIIYFLNPAQTTVHGPLCMWVRRAGSCQYITVYHSSYMRFTYPNCLSNRPNNCKKLLQGKASLSRKSVVGYGEFSMPNVFFIHTIGGACNRILSKP